MRIMTPGILACIVIGLLAILVGEVAYVTAAVAGLAVVAGGMLLSGLALAVAYRRVGTRVAKVAAALSVAFTLTATAAPAYQAYRLANGEAFLPALMAGFMLFTVALAAGSLALRRAGVLPTVTAILVPVTFVVWLILSTAFPVWGGIVGAVAYAGLILVEALAMRQRAAGGANPPAMNTA